MKFFAMKPKIVFLVSLVLLIGSFAMAQKPCSPTVTPPRTLFVNWAQFHFDPAHSGCNPYESTLSPNTVGNLKLVWGESEPGGYATPAVANGILYAGFGHKTQMGEDYGYLYALNASTGTQLWSFPTNYYVAGSPAIANGMVYVTDEVYLYALDANTGALIWTQRTGEFTSPTVANGVVYAPGTNGSHGIVYAFDGKTGALLWQAATAGVNMSSPTVASGMVYVAAGSEDDNVYAFDATTGALLWNYAAGSGVETSPAVANGIVYFGSDDHNVYALRAATGALLWKYATTEVVLSSPVVAYGAVFASSLDGNVYAINAATGALLWKYSLNTSTSELAVANGVLYFGAGDGNAYALNASTGALLLKYSSGFMQCLGWGPIVTNGTVYFGASEQVYAFRLGND